MKNTIIFAFACVVIGGLAYYLLSAPVFPARPKSHPSVSKEAAAPAPKIYTEAEIEAKIAFEKNRQYLQDHWRALVTVAQSGGTQLGIGGGFENVTIRVTNDTDYLINEAVVQITIFRGFRGNKLCHTEDITLYNIPAHAEKSTPYTFTDCGQALQVWVIGFTCTELATGE